MRKLKKINIEGDVEIMKKEMKEWINNGRRS